MNAHTKQQQDKVFETDFIDSQKSDPPFAHLLALSHIYIYTHQSLKKIGGSLKENYIYDLKIKHFRMDMSLHESKINMS